MTYSLLGHHDRATQNAQRALEPAIQCADNATLGRTYYLLAMEAMWIGHYQQGVAYGHQAIACLEQARARLVVAIRQLKFGDDWRMIRLRELHVGSKGNRFIMQQLVVNLSTPAMRQEGTRYQQVVDHLPGAMVQQ